MPQTQPTPSPPLAQLAPLITLCDRPGCNEPAVFSYLWDWGEKGVCCAKHQFELQQAAGNLSRTIQCYPVPTGPAPIERPERVQLITRALVAEAECEEAKSRGLDLYRQNTLQAQSLQALTVRNREAEAQLEVALATVHEREFTLITRDAELGTMADELGRLKLLVPASGALPAWIAERDKLNETIAALRTRDGQLEERNAEVGQLRNDLQRAQVASASQDTVIKDLRAELAEAATLVSKTPQKNR